MAIPEYPSISKERVLAEITPPVGINPTGDTVQMAFVAAGTLPGGGDWNNADWQTPDPGDRTFTARCMIGPGAVELAPGIYHVFVKVTDNPETPVIPAGIIRIF